MLNERFRLIAVQHSDEMTGIEHSTKEEKTILSNQMKNSKQQLREKKKHQTNYTEQQQQRQ